MVTDRQDWIWLLECLLPVRFICSLPCLSVAYHVLLSVETNCFHFLTAANRYIGALKLILADC